MNRRNISLWTLALLLLEGCSNFTINGTMCDQIQSEPNTQNIPVQCRKYDEKEAEKAFFNKKQDKNADIDDVIEFQKEKEEK